MSIVPTSLNHVLRIPLAAEVHSRPSMCLQGTETLTHLAVYQRTGTQDEPQVAARPHDLLADLCRYFGVTGPSADARYFFHDFGHFRLQWESIKIHHKLKQNVLSLKLFVVMLQLWPTLSRQKLFLQ